MRMKLIARASLGGLLLLTVCLATTGALYEMIGSGVIPDGSLSVAV